MPVFQPNDQYPKESIGDMTGTLVIKFKHPENMGFDRKLIEENHFGTIVCGSVGVKNLFMHTEMTHLYKETEDGLVLISRFWMGKSLKNKFLRKKIMNETMVRGMAEHCCVEYRSLAEILPVLYKEIVLCIELWNSLAENGERISSMSFAGSRHADLAS